jgi:hypothetical protein
MHIQLNVFKSLTGLMALAAMLLVGCGGGGGDGPAIKADPQRILFGVGPILPLSGTATVLATASTGLTISYSSSTPAVCTVNSQTGLVKSLTVGSCLIAADQAGNSEFAPAPQVTQSLAVVYNPVQRISFGTAPVLSLYGTASVSATASSSLAVSYSSTTPAICSVNSSNGSVIDIAAGDCTIAADQAGNAYYNPALQVTQTLAVSTGAGPLTVAGAPTGVRATLGTAPNTVVLSFVGPVISGGSPVAAYSVTSVPSGITATGTTSPITVTCTDSCAGYAFTVLAINDQGRSLPSTQAAILTGYNVTATFFEPDTQPQNSIFTGSFTVNSTTQTVSNLAGLLTESMTGPPMVKVPLTYQLSAVSDGMGGLLVTSFALNSTNTFSEGGFAASSEGLYYGYPRATSPAAGGAGNAFATIYVNLASPGAALTQVQINKLAYGDCFAGGMMGDTCMTGYWGRGTMGGYPVSQTITRP